MYNEGNEIKYHEEGDRRELIKRLAIGTVIALIIIIIFLLIKGCGKEEDTNTGFDMEKTLLEAGKQYYNEQSYKLPTAPAECNNVTLDTLVNLKYLKASKYDDCDDNLTYVKVCKLESGTYHYVPILACDSLDSDDLYGSWSPGTEKDLVVDESDIKFSYQIKYLDTTNSTLGPIEEMWLKDVKYKNYKTISTTQYYRYKDLQYLWNVTTKSYYMVNGSYGYSATAPTGYPINEGGILVASRSRTWTAVGTPIETEPTHMYKCDNPDDEYPTRYYNSFTPCDEQTNNPGFTVLIREFYTCDGAVTEVESSATCYACTTGGLNTPKTSCGSYGAWDYSSTTCTGGTDVCQNLTTPVTMYKWYKTSSVMPTQYYTTAPSAGATKTTTSRWTEWTSWSTTKAQDLGTTGTRTIESQPKVKLRQIANFTNSDWKDVNTTYSEDLDALITQLKGMGYEVDSLASIYNSGDLKYEFKLYIRNKR